MEPTLTDEDLERLVSAGAESLTCQIVLHNEECEDPDCNGHDCAVRARWVCRYLCEECSDPHFIFVCDGHHHRATSGEMPTPEQVSWNEIT